jgi:MFS family permease
LSFPAEFGIATPFDQPGGANDEWKVGFVNSAPYISAALVGVWREYAPPCLWSGADLAVSDPLNNYFGRRGEIFITALVLIVTPIASGFTQSWQALLAVRLVLGLALGAKGEFFKSSSQLTLTSQLPLCPCMLPSSPLRVSAVLS